MSYDPIVVTLSSLKPFFFNDLKKELCFSNNAWSIRAWNPIRANAQTIGYNNNWRKMYSSVVAECIIDTL